MSELTDTPADLLIVGGGINGAAIARDAAGRGLSVLLVEAQDLASATSSASSKLIHGGLRYLEHYEFRLVREALQEREVLLATAPHIIWPLRFVLPHDRRMRPAWMIRLGLFLYDHLGGQRRLPGSVGLDLRQGAEGAPLRGDFRRGFAYSDCWVQDARLVVLNARAAADAGARILTRTRLVAAARRDGGWTGRLRAEDGSETEVAARLLVNAAGPWVGEVVDTALRQNRPRPVRLIKGSHIVVPRLYAGEHAYILQNDDRRVVFAIPYEERFTLIGTTDVPFAGDPRGVAIDPAEADYLCAAASRYFAASIGPADVVWSYAGVRALYDDAADNPSAVTRDYRLEVDAPAGQAPMLSIYGGKITTARRLAEHAMEKLEPFLPGLAPAWTARRPLPGGDLPDGDPDRFAADMARRHPWLPAALVRRWTRAYGTLSAALLGDAAGPGDLGRLLGGDLFEREVAFLRDREWARSAADVLWRRSKLGLHLDAAGQAAVAEWLGG